jgi:paraquat-inducible protein A
VRRVTIACPDCGTLQDVAPLAAGATAICPTCGSHLERSSGRSIEAALACAFATFLLLFPANLLPLMRVSILGETQETYISSGVMALWRGHWVILAICVCAFAIVLPILRFGLLSAVLFCLKIGRRPVWLGSAFRWAIHLDLWAMPDVFLIGCFIGYSRVEAKLSTTVAIGGFCLMAAAFFSMIARATLDRRTVWRALMAEGELPEGEALSCTICDFVAPLRTAPQTCPRCGARLRARKPEVVIRTAALLLAGLVLYIPANYFPMSVDTQLGEEASHRIIDGIIDLFQAGLGPLGVLIFCTSIAIPLLKIAGMSWFLLSIRRRSRKRLVLKSKLYRLIDEIGRWSTVDVFTVAVFVPLMQFGPLVTTGAARGSTAFLLVIVLTMIASRVFDPRLMWDAATAGAE